jgi:hypothetical protein
MAENDYQDLDNFSQLIGLKPLLDKENTSMGEKGIKPIPIKNLTFFEVKSNTRQGFHAFSLSFFCLGSVI